MSEKKKKQPIKSHKGEGNQKTKRRKKAKVHSQQKKEGSPEETKKINNSQKTPLEVGKSENVDHKNIDQQNEEAIENDKKSQEVESEVKESVIEERESEGDFDNSSIEEQEPLQLEEPGEEDVELSQDNTAQSATSVVDDEFEIENENLDTIQETEVEDTESNVESQVPTEIQAEESEPVQAEILPLDQIEDEPISPVGKLLKKRIAKYGKKFELAKFMLPLEKHLSSKMVIYFDEWQIIFGFLIVLSSIVSYPVFQIFEISLILFISGLALMTTGYASEEVHITNLRILIRRMNWVDRIFRIPRDSQYILDEIVAFDVQRAPMNQALFLSGLLTLSPLAMDQVRSILPLTYVIIFISIIIIVMSQRLGKRTLSFIMSGGSQVHIGQYKGIPYSVVETFVKIIMEKNVFQSDSY